MAHVLKMKVRVELMVVKGPSVYLVLFNMKYKPLCAPHSPLPLCYCERVSVVRSPLKARFPCSSRGGSLGNLITRLKALSIRQITRSVRACVCVALHPHPVHVCFLGIHGRRACMCSRRLPTEHRLWTPSELGGTLTLHQLRECFRFHHGSIQGRKAAGIFTWGNTNTLNGFKTYSCI